MDPKKKNQEVSEKQKEVLDERNRSAQLEESIQNATPEELRKMLSKRNEDFLFKLEKLLRETGLTPGDAKLKTDGLLKEIVIAQRQSKPATQLYGTPQAKLEDLLNMKKTTQDAKFWQRGVDNALLYLAIFAGMFGIVGLFSKSQQPIGVVTIFAVGLLFGFLMTYYNDLILMKKEDRPAWWKMLLGGMGIVLVVFALITTLELPFLRIINPVLPGWASLIIGVLAFLGRRYFRAHYHITTSSFSPAPK